MDRNFPCGSPDIRLSKQTALLNMFKEPKENVDTELKKKKNQKTMYGKKRDQIGILELENTITKVKISLQVFNSVLEDAEERISKLKDRTIKVSSLRSRKKEKKSEQSLRDCGMQLSKPIHVV